MSFAGFLKDKVYAIVLHIAGMILTGVFLRVMGNDGGTILVLLTVWFTVAALYFAISFLLRRREAVRLDELTRSLSQKYLLAEVVGKPSREEAKPYYRMLRAANKSMTERITEIAGEAREHREYVEQWVHEIKTPIAAVKLIAENNPGPATEKILPELGKIEDFVEQALFYARSESVEQDFLVRETLLSGCLSRVVAANKHTFIRTGVRIETAGLDRTVYSDAKWLEFILKQLLVNAVQYRRESGAVIAVSAAPEAGGTRLTVRDNGIGILESELPRVFEKGFTGSNGRRESRSTGIGLYLCRKLCRRLGVEISVQSAAGEYTEVSLFFSR